MLIFPSVFSCFFSETVVRNIQEAVLLHAFHSPYIVKYYNSFLERGKLYVIMEYAPNGSLQGVLNVCQYPSIPSITLPGTHQSKTIHSRAQTVENLTASRNRTTMFCLFLHFRSAYTHLLIRLVCLFIRYSLGKHYPSRYQA